MENSTGAIECANEKIMREGLKGKWRRGKATGSFGVRDECLRCAVAAERATWQCR